MVKSKLTDGTSILVIQLAMYVSGSVMITCLADYYYNRSGGFDNDDIAKNKEKYMSELLALKKREGFGIIKRQLKRFGQQGEFHDGFFEAATDIIEDREFWIEACRNWVNKNYPYLSNS